MLARWISLPGFLRSSADAGRLVESRDVRSHYSVVMEREGALSLSLHWLLGSALEWHFGIAA